MGVYVREQLFYQTFNYDFQAYSPLSECILDLVGYVKKVILLNYIIVFLIIGGGRNNVGKPDKFTAISECPFLSFGLPTILLYGV